MVTFEFEIRDPSGLQAGPAGQLVKEAISCSSKVTIRKGEKSGDAKLIFHVLSLSAKRGDRLEIMVEGEREQEEASRLKAFVEEHMK